MPLALALSLSVVARKIWIGSGLKGVNVIWKDSCCSWTSMAEKYIQYELSFITLIITLNVGNINSTLLTSHSRCEPWRKWKSSHMGCGPLSCYPAFEGPVGLWEVHLHFVWAFLCVWGDASVTKKSWNQPTQTLMMKVQKVIRGLQESKCCLKRTGNHIVLLFTSASAHKSAMSLHTICRHKQRWLSVVEMGMMNLLMSWMQKNEHFWWSNVKLMPCVLCLSRMHSTENWHVVLL